MVFNPEKRPSAESCLKHSYVARFHSKKDNLDVGYNVIPPINDDIQLTVDEYRQRLYAMIQVEINTKQRSPDRCTDWSDPLYSFSRPTNTDSFGPDIHVSG